MIKNLDTLKNIAQNFINNPNSTEKDFKPLYPFIEELLKLDFIPSTDQQNGLSDYNFLGALFFSSQALKSAIDYLVSIESSKNDLTGFNFTNRRIYSNKEVTLYQAIGETFDPMNYSVEQNRLIYESMQGLISNFQNNKQGGASKEENKKLNLKNYNLYKNYWEKHCSNQDQVQTNEIKEFLTQVEALVLGNVFTEKINNEVLEKIINFENKKNYTSERMNFYRMSSIAFLTTVIEHSLRVGACDLIHTNSVEFSKKVSFFTDIKRTCLIDLSTIFNSEHKNLKISQNNIGTYAITYPLLESMHKKIKAHRVMQEKYHLESVMCKSDNENLKSANKI